MANDYALKIGYVDALQNKYTATREEFVKLIEAGLVTEDTPVMVNGAFYPVGSLHTFDAEFDARRGKLPKVADVASFYGFDANVFESWLRENGALKSGILSSFVEGPLTNIVARFGILQGLTAPQQAAEKAKRDQIDRVIVTTGSNVEGRQIVRYLDIVSADKALLINRGSEQIETRLLAGLPKSRSFALTKLREQANAFGANAIIGLEFKTTALAMETVTPKGGALYEPYLFMITATGTAVEVQPLANRADESVVVPPRDE